MQKNVKKGLIVKIKIRIWMCAYGPIRMLIVIVVSTRCNRARTHTGDVDLVTETNCFKGCRLYILQEGNTFIHVNIYTRARALGQKQAVLFCAQHHGAAASSVCVCVCVLKDGCSQHTSLRPSSLLALSGKHHVLRVSVCNHS